MSDHTHCATCDSTLNRIYHNRLDGADGWVYVCPTCEDRAVDKTEPAIPHCIQCGHPMNLDGDTWVCGTCCWTRDQNDHWSHDTLRLATRTLTAENQTNLNTPAEAYVAGFLAAWDKALELCRSLENQLGEHA